MANFCTKCGTALSPDKRSCTNCGAPVGPPEDIPAAPAYQQAAPAQPGYQPVYQQPAASYGAQPVAAAPVQGGSSAVKVILIVVGVILGLGMLSVIVFMFGMWRVSRAVHVNSSGDGVTLSTPTGSISTGRTANISEADLGAAIYPGAARREGGMQISSANGSMVTAIYATNDPAAKVIDFYKGKMGENAAVIETGKGAIITEGQHGKESVIITITGDDAATDGQTKIAIMHSKSK